MRGVRDVVADGRYRGVILDQFGVLHDGATPHRGASEALRELRAHGVQTVVLSNSSRRSAPARAKLAAMIPDALVPPVVTSGELARALLSAPNSPVPSFAGPVLHANWCGRGKVTRDDAGFSSRPATLAEVRDDPSCVCAVVAHGTEGITDGQHGDVSSLSWEGLIALVKSVARARPDIPFVCVNPDNITVDGPGFRVMPGELAKEWEKAGGSQPVRMGKPGKIAYDAALAVLETQGVRPDEVLAIGDSVAHDIAGAHTAGIDTLYVAGGIHAPYFGLRPEAHHPDVDDWSMNWEAWDRVVFLESPGCKRPTHVLDYFRW